MSALPSETDIRASLRDACFVLQLDIRLCRKVGSATWVAPRLGLAVSRAQVSDDARHPAGGQVPWQLSSGRAQWQHENHMVSRGRGVPTILRPRTFNWIQMLFPAL